MPERPADVEELLVGGDPAADDCGRDKIPEGIAPCDTDEGIGRLREGWLPFPELKQRHEHLKGIPHHADDPQGFVQRTVAISQPWRQQREGAASEASEPPFNGVWSQPSQAQCYGIVGVFRQQERSIRAGLDKPVLERCAGGLWIVGKPDLKCAANQHGKSPQSRIPETIHALWMRAWNPLNQIRFSIRNRQFYSRNFNDRYRPQRPGLVKGPGRLGMPRDLLGDAVCPNLRRSGGSALDPVVGIEVAFATGLCAAKCIQSAGRDALPSAHTQAGHQGGEAAGIPPVLPAIHSNRGKAGLTYHWPRERRQGSSGYLATAGRLCCWVFPLARELVYGRQSSDLRLAQAGSPHGRPCRTGHGGGPGPRRLRVCGVSL